MFFLNKIKLSAKQINNNSGFTLIELMVGISLFVIALTIASAILVNIIKSERLLLKKSVALGNMSLLIEQIAREVKTARGGFFVDFNGDGNADEENGKGDILRFTNARGMEVVYKWTGAPDWQITKQEDFSSPLPITAKDIQVKSAFFVLSQCSPVAACSSPVQQPRVTIKVEVAPSGPGLEDYPKTLQTTINQRYVSLPAFMANCSGECVDGCEPGTNTATVISSSWKVEWTASASGGAIPYDYAWFDDAFGNTSVITMTYTDTPRFAKTAGISITDSGSLIAKASCNITIEAPPPPPVP